MTRACKTYAVWTMAIIAFTQFSSAVMAEETYFPFDVKSYNGISYVSGGIGFDERKALDTVGKTYSLKLVFAKMGGAFVAIVDVEIKDNAERTIFKATSRGPWLYADLPSGRYTVTAASKGARIEKEIIIDGSTQTEARFYWH